MWTLIGTISYLRYYLQHRPGTYSWFEFLIWQTCFIPWIAISPLVFRLEQKYPLGGTGWLPRSISLAAIGVPIAYLGAEISLVLSLMIKFLFGQQLEVPRAWWVPPIQELWIFLLLYCSVVAAGYVIRNLLLLNQREQEAIELALQKSRLESSLRQAELETLRTRLNPHFLFNCLQNIAVLTQEDPKSANQMLTRLGDLLRTALRSDSGPETTLKSEIALTKSYVVIEKIRFGDRLSVLFDIDPHTESSLLPTFLLQPLVENAIVHGLHDMRHGGIISIRSSIESDSLVLSVTDNGMGLNRKHATTVGNGVGLSSTCERLARMYPQQHTFSLRPLPEGGTEVLIAIPLRFGLPRGEASVHEQTSLIDR